MLGNFDLHLHSRYSFDGLMSPQYIVRLAKKRGLSGIAITDHNTIAGGAEAFASNNDKDILVIVGTEIYTEIGDILGLFLSREIKSRRSEDVVDEIHSQGGWVVLPHPYHHHKEIPVELLRKIDAVEIFNGRTGADYSQKAIHDISIPYNLGIVGNSDAHLPWEIGRVYNSIEIESFNTISVFDSLINKRCKPVTAKPGRSASAVYISKFIKRLRRFI
ncbi:MAG: PHP domain-containing protein [Anaerolineales bacterium]|nr:PHP domain-containing protein [Anaerolineales bacterium]